MSRLAILVVAGLVGCGSSRDPEQHPPADVGVAEPFEAAPPPTAARTMKQVSLFGDTPVYNLVIDPTFETGNPGIGRWYSNIGVALNGNGPDVAQSTLSASPVGLALPVGKIADAPDEGKPRTFTLLAQLPGGTGPYVVSLWVSSDKPSDVAMSEAVRVGVASATGSSGLAGLEIPRDPAEQRTIGGRIWHRYRGEVAGPFALGAFLTLRFKASRTQWWLQSPEVVPKGLLAPSATMSLPLARAIELDVDERAAIAAYRRVPLNYGVVTAPARPR